MSSDQFHNNMNILKIVWFCKTLNISVVLKDRHIGIVSFWWFVCFCLFVWCLTMHQPLWVISVRRYLTKHDVDGKNKKLYDKIKGIIMKSLYNDNKLQYDC